MRSEYDFSTGKRGKFYSKNANMHLPSHAMKDIRAALAETKADIAANRFVKESAKAHLARLDAMDNQD